MRKIVPANAVLIPSEAECVFKGIIYDVYQWPQKLYNGTTKTFEMLRRPDSVRVIAIKDDKIVIVEEEQPRQAISCDFPGGFCDVEDKDELCAAQRELAEETGLVFRTWKLLDVVQLQRKIEAFSYIFLATDFLRKTAPSPDAGEKITIKLMSLDDIKRLSALPSSRHMGRGIVQSISTLQELKGLPEYRSLS